MVKENQISTEEAELKAAIESVLKSSSPKKLIIAGPGTGKTTLFKNLLELETGDPDRRIILTFINNLKDNLEEVIVGLTRTRKKCTLIHTRNFAGSWKNPSSFISWINPNRFENIEVNASYWR
jgi:superfamily I DNA/RNA helicase